MAEGYARVGIRENRTGARDAGNVVGETGEIMPIMKRATMQLRKAGIYGVCVWRGMYGFMPYDPDIHPAQSGRVYDTCENCVKGILAGDRPWKVEVDDAKPL